MRAHNVCTSCGNIFSRYAAAPTSKKKKGHSKRRTTRGRSARQEKHAAKKYGGRVTANSGALDDKGDIVVAGRLRIEAKTTKASSFKLKLSDLEKIRAQSSARELPVFQVCFEDDLNKQYCVVSLEDLLALVEGYDPE